MYYTVIIVFFCFLIAAHDLLTYRIPDSLLVIFLLLTLFSDGSLMNENLTLRLIISAFVLFLFSAIWYFTQGIGLGDVKYASLLGFLLAPVYIIKAFIVTALLGVIIYFIGILIFRWSNTIRIPYAPFLSAGAIFAVSGVL